MPQTVKLGSTGADVKECQRLLTLAEYPTLVDGEFGPGTERSVKRFQLVSLLKADGVVGPQTWEALEENDSIKPQLTLPIDFRHVAKLLPQMMPQQYKLHNAQCPSNPPGMDLQRIGDEWTNCVQFTAWLLSHGFSGVSFTPTQWKLWMVGQTDQGNVPVVPNWGPKVVLDWGVATTAPGAGAYLVQYFTETGGHNLIVVDYDPETDKILTLEANSAYGLNGAGWGEIGNLRDVFNPGLSWPEKVSQTWESRFGPKIAVHKSRLSIDPVSIKDWLSEG